MDFRYFKYEDFDCQETGENNMDVAFIKKLDELRESCGFPFIITSGYRSESHSLETRKKKAGQHTKGIAADIRVTNGIERFKVAQKAFELGFTGIGIAKTFVHVDMRTTEPMMWSY
jgi:uncharacterized protein YcbK (DUF882 family)|tara:strand:+ start:686 stop:1033 length:348 start_codon:yes stop_codon:yes gene_type:complete